VQAEPGEAVVGECGWLRGPDPDGDTEVGFGVAPGARDRGLGTEAVAVLSAWVERQDGVRRVTAEVLVGNEPSHRLLTRLGFAPVGGVPPYVTYARDAAHVDRPSNSG
jgi:ribosomal-protein-alanine N-acetyltransferase